MLQTDTQTDTQSGPGKELPRPPQSAVSIVDYLPGTFCKILIWQAHFEQIHSENVLQKGTLGKMSLGKKTPLHPNKITYMCLVAEYTN